MTEELDNQESSNLDAETSEVVDTSQEEATAELNRAKEYAQNQKIRAEKAEQELKALKKPAPQVEEVAPKKTSKLSLSELEEAAELLEIPKEDRQEVTDYAERKGISIAEAKKNPFIKTFLGVRDEERKTAGATNTGEARRGTSTLTDEQIVQNYKNGIIDESDEGIQRLVNAELNLKRKIAKGGK